MRFEQSGLIEACGHGHVAIVDWLLSKLCVARSVADRVAAVKIEEEALILALGLEEYDEEDCYNEWAKACFCAGLSGSVPLLEVMHMCMYAVVCACVRLFNH